MIYACTYTYLQFQTWPTVSFCLLITELLIFPFSSSDSFLFQWTRNSAFGVHPQLPSLQLNELKDKKKNTLPPSECDNPRSGFEGKNCIYILVFWNNPCACMGKISLSACWSQSLPPCTLLNNIRFPFECSYSLPFFFFVCPSPAFSWWPFHTFFYRPNY